MHISFYFYDFFILSSHYIDIVRTCESGLFIYLGFFFCFVLFCFFLFWFNISKFDAVLSLFFVFISLVG